MAYVGGQFVHAQQRGIPGEHEPRAASDEGVELPASIAEIRTPSGVVLTRMPRRGGDGAGRAAGKPKTAVARPAENLVQNG